jgi:Na+-transporting NADH:ubiquinone oxidoreductase subunit C
MAINKESNVYTIIFATIMVVVVGGLLAFLSLALKPAQVANMQNEKKQNIIQATGFMDKDKVIRDEAGDLFKEMVTQRITIDFEGNVVFDSKVDGEEIDPKNEKDAFNVEPRAQFRTPDKEKLFPIFVCEKDGKKVYVVSCSGKGLWDDVWGYVGLAEDGNSVVAAKFDHKGETAGLGSVINEAKFQDQFNLDQGKQLAGPNGGFKGIEVIKPGSRPLDQNSVDGLSGATFTGSGVKDMLMVYLEVYYNYFNKG